MGIAKFVLGRLAMKKTNPRRRPATFADVERAKKEASESAVRTCWAIFFTVLYDKEHAQLEDVQRVWNEINELSKSVSGGYVSVSDLCNVLKEEYGVNLV